MLEAWLAKDTKYKQHFSGSPKEDQKLVGNIRMSLWKEIRERSKEEKGKEDKDRDVELIEALDWAMEQLDWSDSSTSGGSGNLKVNSASEKNEITIKGRPGFEKPARELPGVKKGIDARRHIIAWHTLKKAIRNVVNQILKLEETPTTGEGTTQLTSLFT